MRVNILCWIYFRRNIKTCPVDDIESFRLLYHKPFVTKIYQRTFLIPSASTLKVKRAQCFLCMLHAIPDCPFASWIWAVSQDPHDQGYRFYKYFTSLPTSFSHGSKQSWLNIHGTIVAWSHFLLGNKPPVYTVLFWASQAAVTTAFLLPVRLCIISTDSTLVKRYAVGCAIENVSKKKLHRGCINYDNWKVTCKVACSLVPGSGGVQVERKSWRVKSFRDRWGIRWHESGRKKVLK